MSFRIFLASALSLPVLLGQAPLAAPSPAAKSVSSAADWGTRIVQLKYLDPDQLRGLFPGRSFAMEANHELKVLTVTGPTQFLNEVEQTGKRFDLPPPQPANIEVTVYLLSNTAEASAAKDIPPDLQALAKTLSAGGGEPLKLADSETVRVREGQGGDVSFSDSTASGARLSHISLQSAAMSPGEKGEVLSLTGLHCWLSKASGQAGPGGDLTASIDVAPNEAALVAKSGIEKPLIVIVKASLSRSDAKPK